MRGRRGRSWSGATRADLADVGAYARGDSDGVLRLITHSLARCGALHDSLSAVTPPTQAVIDRAAFFAAVHAERW